MNGLSGLVISIRKYLQADRRAEEALERLCRLLLEGMDQSAPEDESEARARLRESTRSALAAMVEGSPPDELLERGARATEALKNYHSHAVERALRPLAELRAKVILLTQAITSVSASSSENIRRLQEIRDKILRAVDGKELRSLRVSMSQCLDHILVEAQRQQVETALAAGQLNRRAAPAGDPEGATHAPAAVDPITGLPSRAEAEDAIAQACQSEDNAFVIVMVVNRMQAVNQNFGDHVSNAILARFSGFLSHQLLPVDQVFRWSGPTIAALVRRGNADRVRSEIGALMAQKLEYTASTPSRTVQLPISARWTVLPLSASPRLLFRKMDSFADLG